MLWNYVESDSVYAGKTTMFVTNDHGRHTDDFSGHDCECEGCRTVQLLAVGPDIKQGMVSNVPRTICDITPTIGEIMGFPTETATGSVMHEILSQGTLEETTRAANEDDYPDSGAVAPSDTINRQDSANP
jgi:hypothetical protein